LPPFWTPTAEDDNDDSVDDDSTPAATKQNATAEIARKRMYLFIALSVLSNGIIICLGCLVVVVLVKVAARYSTMDIRLIVK
jgi:hypothetical protein